MSFRPLPVCIAMSWSLITWSTPLSVSATAKLRVRLAGLEHLRGAEYSSRTVVSLTLTIANRKIARLVPQFDVSCA